MAEVKKPSKLDELKGTEKDLLDLGYPDNSAEVSVVRQRIRDLENKQLDKTYQEYPSQSIYENPEAINLDYSDIMKQVTGSYPKEQEDLDEWKRNYANRSIKSTVPLETTAEEIGVFDPSTQNFSEVVKTPEFQQFLKDMQEELVSEDRSKTTEEGTKGIRGTLTEILYPQGIEASRSGKEYGLGDAAVETAFNVGEAVPWGAPFKIGAVGRVGAAIARVLEPVSKIPVVGPTVYKGIEEIPGKAISLIPSVARKVEQVPFGAIANQAIMPVARESYNVLGRDKDLSDAAIDAGFGTGVNFGTPLAVKGALRGTTRALKIPTIAAKLEKLTRDVENKRAAEELEEATGKLYKKKGLNGDRYVGDDINMFDELEPKSAEPQSELGTREKESIKNALGKSSMDAYEKIAKKANLERKIAPRLIGYKDYSNLIKELKFNENPLAQPYHEYIVRSAKPPRSLDERMFDVLSNPNATEESIGSRLDDTERFGKRQDPIDAYGAWVTEDPYLKSLRYNIPGANQSAYYTKAQAKALGDKNLKGKLTEESRRLMDLKGTKDPLAIEKIGKYTPVIESVEDLAEMGKEFGINALGQNKDAARVIPYVGDKLVDSREAKKNIAKESHDEKEARWENGYATFEERKTPEYKAWEKENIQKLAR